MNFSTVDGFVSLLAILFFLQGSGAFQLIGAERRILRMHVGKEIFEKERGREYDEVRKDYFSKLNASDEGAIELPTSPFSTISQADLDLDFLSASSSNDEDGDIDNDEEDEDEDGSKEDVHPGTSSKSSYNAELGMESILVTLGDRRSLLPSEYEVAFNNFPGLADAVSKGMWPERRILGEEEQEWIKAALNSKTEVVTDREVNLALGKFRKTILGLEKYRINNPGSVAEKYCSIVKTCLRLKGAWGAAANALEYAGLIIRDHVEEEGAEMKKTKVPVLDLTSLWRHSLVRLLDMEYKDDSAETLVGTQTYDQKFFSQVPLTETGKMYIQDMMLTILRVSLRALFSRETVKDLVIKYAIDPSDPLQPLMPKDMSIQIIVEDEFSIEYIEDVEAGVGFTTMSYQVSNPMPISEF